MKVHCMALVLVLIAGIVAKLTVVEWCICMIMCALVLSLELVNTAVEAVVDLATEEKKPLAKIAKDTAAGAVLIAAIASVIVGLLIFVPTCCYMDSDYDIREENTYGWIRRKLKENDACRSRCRRCDSGEIQGTSG